MTRLHPGGIIRLGRRDFGPRRGPAHREAGCPNAEPVDDRPDAVALPHPQDLYPQYWRGYAFLAARGPADAVAEFQTVISLRSLGMGTLTWSLAHLGLAGFTRQDATPPRAGSTAPGTPSRAHNRPLPASATGAECQACELSGRSAPAVGALGLSCGTAALKGRPTAEGPRAEFRVTDYPLAAVRTSRPPGEQEARADV